MYPINARIYEHNKKYIRIVLYRILQNYLKTIIYYKYKTTEVQVNLPAVKYAVSGYIDNKISKEEFERMKEKNLVLE